LGIPLGYKKCFKGAGCLFLINRIDGSLAPEEGWPEGVRRFWGRFRGLVGVLGIGRKLIVV